MKVVQDSLKSKELCLKDFQMTGMFFCGSSSSDQGNISSSLQLTSQEQLLTINVPEDSPCLRQTSQKKAQVNSMLSSMKSVHFITQILGFNYKKYSSSLGT